MTDGIDSDAQTPAEERLLAYIETLREEPPESTGRLVAEIVRTARWQSALRPYLQVAGTLAGALVIAARVVVDPRAER
jgi:hypothetical protein